MPVTLSGAEGPPAGWLRSLGYARGDKTCERDDKVNLAHVAYSLITRYPLSTLN